MGTTFCPMAEDSPRVKVHKALSKWFKDIPVFVGFDYISELQKALGKPFIFADHAYFQRGHGPNGNYRVIYSDIHQRTVKPWVTTHKTYRYNSKPWRALGKHILLFPPSDTIRKTFKAGDWEAGIIAGLKHHTNRPVKIKAKHMGALRPFLQDAWAVIGYGTVASVEAVNHGYPAFCGPHCPATAVGLTDLSQIEKPVLPDREAWWNTLTWSQFSMEEIGKGLCYESLMKDIHGA